MFVNKGIQFLVVVASCVYLRSDAWSTGTSGGSSRRAWLKETVAPSLATVLSLPTVASAASKEESNEFIDLLKARSDAKRDLYLKEAQRSDKLSPSQFNLQFRKPRFVGVYVNKDDPSSAKMVLAETFEKMLANDQIIVEYGLAYDKDGNEFVDYAQKTYIFKDKNAIAYAKANNGLPPTKQPVPPPPAPVAPPVTPPPAPVAPPVTPPPAPVAQPVNPPPAPVAQPVNPPPAPVAQPVTPPPAPVAQPVTPPPAPVAQPVTPPPAPVAQPVTPPPAPVAQPVTPPPAPVAQSVTPPPAPVAQPVPPPPAPVAQPVTPPPVSAQ